MATTTNSIPEVVNAPRLGGGISPPQIKKRNPRDLNMLEVPEDPYFDEARETAASMVAGELPESVRRQVEDLAAERSLSRGIGTGQASRNLMLRDLGLNSLDLSSRGLEAAESLSALAFQRNTAYASINTDREKFNEDLNKQMTALREESRQANQQYATALLETENRSDQVNLQTLDLISRNQQATQNFINSLVIQNTRYAVDGLQDHIIALEDYFGTTNDAIRRIMGV